MKSALTEYPVSYQVLTHLVSEFNNHSTELMFYVQATASIFLWYRLLYYLRMFKSVSYIIRALFAII